MAAVTRLRNVTVAVLAVVAVLALGVAEVPGWDNLRLVGLAAVAVIATDLLSRSGGLPR